MNGKHHFQLSFYILTISFLIAFYENTDMKLFEQFGFYFLLITIYLNPDSDTKSTSSNNLGIFRYIFLPLKHRGISHSPVLWLIVSGVLVYYGYVAEGLGVLVSSYTHIFSDWVYSGVKNNFVIKFVRKVF